MTALLQRLHTDRSIDIALALAVLATALAERFTTDPTPLLVLGTVLVPLPLLGRRRRTVLAAIGALAICTALVAAGISTKSAAAPWVSLLLLAYASGRHARRWFGAPELVLLVLANEVVWGMADGAIPTDRTYPAIFTACAWAVGRWVRYDAAVAARVHEESARVLERAEADRERARAAERRRIAREMHDVIAHSVSVMVVQAGGARRILDLDAGRAIEAAMLIEHTGREALEELRALLGVIGAEPERSGAPSPSLLRLAELVDRGTEAGLSITLDAPDDLAGIPAGVDMAAYRIVQEALTNALRHAGPVGVRVRVARVPAQLELEIENDPPHGQAPTALTRPGGHGMMGMAERAALYCGALDAGPTGRGGFRVHARLNFQDHRMETAA